VIRIGVYLNHREKDVAMNLSEMTDDELRAEMKEAYGRYMYEEAAERFYNHDASSRAFARYVAAKTALEARAESSKN
jgi:hypothetical protein